MAFLESDRKFQDQIYFKLFKDLQESAEARYSSTGDVHEEHVMMTVIGYELFTIRGSTSKLEELAKFLKLDPRRILLAELGLLEPSVFFALLPRWAEYLGANSDTLIADMNRHFQQNHENRKDQ